jgi:Ni/Co efflux regulator RcnB
MRKLLISLLIVGAAATPALADPGDRTDRDTARAERQSVRAERQQARAERAPPAQRPQFTGQGRLQGSMGGAQQLSVRPQRFQQSGGADPAQLQAFQDARTEGGTNDGAPSGGRNWRRGQRQQMIQGQGGGAESLRQLDRPLPGVMQARTRSPMVSDVPRQGMQPPLRTDGRRFSGSQHWNTNWRNDNRYDWRNYRNHHRSQFHFGFYSDPFGWGYQPFSIGWRLWPSYYGSNYWINDPWEYRLPYAPPGTRWVRYYDDALLVDTWTGEVVDAIRDFFW